MKFKKKPIIIEAFQITTWKDVPNWFIKALNKGIAFYDMDNGHKLTIKTLEGNMKVNEGDWIIKGINGELYPCKHDIFKKTYERIKK